MSENQNFNVDEALKQLEEINSKLSQKDIALDAALELYKKGVVLSSKCKEHLDGVEKELQIISTK